MECLRRQTAWDYQDLRSNKLSKNWVGEYACHDEVGCLGMYAFLSQYVCSWVGFRLTDGCVIGILG